MNLIITRSCYISPGKIVVDGLVAYDSDEKTPTRFLKAAYRHFTINYPKFFKMDNLSKLAFLTAELVLKGMDVSDRYASGDTGLILLNSSSSLETDEKHQETISDRGRYFPSPSVFVYTLPNIMSGEIAIRHKIKGENAVMISEHFDPDLLFQFVNELFLNGRVQCCLAGWVECYHDHMEAILVLIEKEENAKSFPELKESIIFEPRNLERIYKDA